MTQVKRAKDNLNESEEKYRQLFENLSDAAFLVDLQTGLIIDTTMRGAALLGRSHDEIVGMQQTELYPPAKADEYRHRFARNTKQGHIVDYEAEVIRKDGTIVPVTISSSALTVDGHRLVLGVFRDITERKQAEEALQETNKRLDAQNKLLRAVNEELRESKEHVQFLADLLERSSQPLAVGYPDGQLMTFNTAYCKLLGYSKEELLKLKWDTELTPPEWRKVVAKAAEEMVRTGYPQRFEKEYIRKDGSRVPVEVYAHPSFDDNGNIQYYYSFFTDITERKRAEEALRKTHSKLERLVEKRTAKLDKANKALRVDITERKRAEEALKESEELSSSLLDNTPNPISVINPDTSIRYINPALEKLTGFSSAEVIGRKSPYPWWQKEKQQQYSRDFEGAMRNGTHRIERLFQRKNGEQFWVDVTSTAMTGDGKLKYFLSNWVDITERKRAEEALRRSEEGFRNIYEESPIGIELYDSNGRLITVNKACLDIFGVSDVAEVKGFNLFEDPNITDEVKQRLHKRKTVRYEAPFDFEKVKKHKLYNTSKSGTIYLNVLITPLGARGEKPLGGYLVQVQDITERKKVEQTLRKSEENFRALAENANDGIIIIAGNGQLLYVNRRAAEITGHSRRDMSEIHISRHIHPDELKKVLHRLARRLSGKVVPRRYETLLVRKDGSTMPIELVGAKTTWHGEPAVLAIVRDISEQKQLRENMEFYITEVTKAQETERKRIARDLHDETAQSLSMLSLEIDALRDEKGLRKKAVSRLEHLRARVEQILEGVRRFSKELRPSILDELGLIPALQIMVDEVSVKDNINSRMDIVGAERRLSPEIEVGLFRISQEALSNIRRHSQATEVKVKSVFTPQNVKLTIEDNGVGFVLPYKLGDFAGRGKLGIYGMMERARLLDSSLKIRTRPGKGTTISIETKVES